MQQESWYSGLKKEFLYKQRLTIVVEPKEALPGKPWVWRMEFFGAFPSVDAALLEAGYHVVYHSVSDLYGCPWAISELGRFQEWVQAEYGLSDKPALFGFSRGGLYAVNYALTYPARVGLLYLDAPVLDFRSWPGQRYPDEWKQCLESYGLTEETARTYRGTPLDRAAEVAALNIPLIAVVGDADQVVPVRENIDPFMARYKAAGGRMAIIRKPDCDHHPHSLSDPAPVVEFIRRELENRA